MKKETEDSFPELNREKFRLLVGTRLLSILGDYFDELELESHPKELSKVVLEMLNNIEAIIIDQQVVVA